MAELIKDSGQKIISDTLNKWGEKRKIFEKNINCTYSEEYKNLDSSLKKITSFIKKIKFFSEINFDLLMKEVKLLNLNRYISEIVSAILELKFKISNIGLLIKFISKIHRRYKKFSLQYFEALRKKLFAFSYEETEKELDRRNLKLFIKLYCDSIFYGLTTDTDIEIVYVVKFWKNLLQNDEENKFVYSAEFSYFIKLYGDDFDIHSDNQINFFTENNMDYKQNFIICAVTKMSLLQSAELYYKNLAVFCIKCARNLKTMEKAHKIYIGLHGELTPDQRENYQKLHELYEKILSSVKILSESLNHTFTICVEEEKVGDVPKITEIIQEEESVKTDNIWEDEENRQFYENLRDFSMIISPVSLKDLENIKRSIRDSHRTFSKTTSKNEEFDEDEDFDLDEYEKLPKQKNAIMNAFITKLQNCTNRDLIDQCVEEFLRFLNTKNNKKTLIEAIFGVQRNRCDLLPFYGRFLATLSPYIPEISIELSILLRKEFYYHIRKHFQFNLESKIKTCRFIGEFVKFKIYSKAEGIQFLKALMQNFQNHTIDMLCHLLETCGGFLYNSSESNPYMKTLMEGIGRKSYHVTDERHKIMLQNAVFYCNYQPNDEKKIKNIPILHQFIKYLLFEALNRSSIKETLNVFKKLPLDDKQCYDFVIKCLTRPWKLKYSHISCLASFVFCLKQIDPNIPMFVVDGILEEIRLGMESNIPRHQQRRLTTIRYFGELYNFQLIEADMLYKVCFNMITFGQSLKGNSSLDPPNSCIRILLVCELLKSSAQFLISDTNFKKFDGFFVVFQAFIWRKKLSHYYTKLNNKFPSNVDFIVQELFDLLKIRKKYYDSPEKVNEVFNRLLNRYCMSQVNNLVEKYTLSGINISSIFTNYLEDLDDHQTQTFSNDSSPQPEHKSIDDELEFEREYEKTLLESINEKGMGMNKQETIDLTLPSHLKDKYSNFQDGLEHEIDDKTQKELKILLLTKKNNKKCLKDVHIPKSDSLALNVINKYHTRKDEQQEVKRFILNMSVGNSIETKSIQTGVAVKSKTKNISSKRGKRQY